MYLGVMPKVANSRTQQGMKENILLVEDEQALQMIVGDRLRKEGYLVDCASDAETGLSKATSQAFDLMIFDIMLPRRSGLDLCRDVRSAGLGAPILLLSAYHHTAVKTAGFELGADDYVTKPFDMLELNARVEALLRRAGSGRSSPRGTNPLQETSTQKSEGSPVQATSQGPIRPPTFPQDRKLREEFKGRIGDQKDFSRLAEAIPRLRELLAQEVHSPQTPRNAAWLGVAEGIVEFLEEVFEGRLPAASADSQRSQ
jgi:CheY-like chemotaxis protein